MHFIRPFTDETTPNVDLLGGKGASLSTMTRMGLPVPPGFIVTTTASRHLTSHGCLPEGLTDELDKAVSELEAATGKTLGSPVAPLLVSVRSGAPVSMPGMMDTLLNVGITQDVADHMDGSSADGTFGQRCLHRFLRSYCELVLGIDKRQLDEIDGDQSATAGPHDPRAAIAALRSYVNSLGHHIPQEPRSQIHAALSAVLGSWNSARAKAYREIEGIDDQLGTAVVVQSMVFGNLDDRSGTGVAFTRDPNTGAAGMYGDWLPRAQGEDVVSGRVKTRPLADLGHVLPRPAAELADVLILLESEYRDLCDVEFTIESDTLWVLQTRVGKRSATAAVNIAVDLATNEVLTRREALERVTAKHVADALHEASRHVDADGALLARGLAASPGTGSGSIALHADEAAKRASAGERVVLVRQETSPEDVHGMAVAAAIVTASGGLVSHAAIVARGLGVPAVCSLEGLTIQDDPPAIIINGVRLTPEDIITVDGSTGTVTSGEQDSSSRSLQVPVGVATLLNWAREVAPLPLLLESSEQVPWRELGADGVVDPDAPLPAGHTRIRPSDQEIRAALDAGATALRCRPADGPVVRMTLVRLSGRDVTHETAGTLAR